MREQVRHDPQRFTPEVVDTLFCNVDEIAAAHRALLADLRRCTRDGDPKWTDEIGQVFLDYVSARFSLAIRAIKRALIERSSKTALFQIRSQ